MRDYFSDRVLFTEFFKSHFNSLTYLWFSKIVFKHKFLKILQKSVWAFEPIRARGFRYQNLLSVKLKELKCPINLVKSAKLYLLSNSYNRKLKMKNPSFGMPGTDGLSFFRGSNFWKFLSWTWGPSVNKFLANQEVKLNMFNLAG